LSPDGEYLISGSEDKTIKIWHLHRGELMQTLEDHTAPVYALDIGADGFLASGSEDKTINLWRPL
ncbi:MAG: WD40 repeat domain-containing protein, partial [Coleofasciculus sp.]